MKTSKTPGISRFFGSRTTICPGALEDTDRSGRLSKIVTLGLFLASVLFVPLSAQALNYHVRVGATGNNNGADWTNAYAALPTTLLRDSVYYIADGTYSGRTFSTATSGTALITIKKATVADHGTSTGWSNTYGDGQAVFNGMFDFTSSYWVIDGQTGGGAGSWNTGFGFKIVEIGDPSAIIRIAYSGTANNITIRHVDLQGKGSVSNQGGYYSNDGIAIYNSASKTTLSYAWLHGIGRCPVFIIGSQNTIFEHLYVSSYFGSSNTHSELMSSGQGTMGDVTWRYSLITDIQSTGGLMWDNNTNPSAHLYVYGNVFYKPAAANWGQANGVIGGWTGGNGEQFRNVWVLNNTFINVDQQTLSTFPNVYSGNIASNNIFYNSQSPDFSKFGTHNYNHFINAGGTHSEANATSDASGGDPFVDYVNLDFRLKTPTTAGTSYPTPYNLDPASTTRGSDGAWDRGAFEFGNNSIATLIPPTNVRITP